ncbi:hypothetical protein ACJX0J_036074, partial [Zea mays]
MLAVEENFLDTQILLVGFGIFFLVEFTLETLQNIHIGTFKYIDKRREIDLDAKPPMAGVYTFVRLRSLLVNALIEKKKPKMTLVHEQDLDVMQKSCMEHYFPHGIKRMKASFFLHFIPFNKKVGVDYSELDATINIKNVDNSSRSFQKKFMMELSMQQTYHNKISNISAAIVRSCLDTFILGLVNWFASTHTDHYHISIHLTCAYGMGWNGDLDGDTLHVLVQASKQLIKCSTQKKYWFAHFIKQHLMNEQVVSLLYAQPL